MVFVSGLEAGKWEDEKGSTGEEETYAIKP